MDDPVFVEIPTVDGVTLRGDFYKADADGAPAVAMTAGLTLLRVHGVRDLARKFQEAGISALAYDHRGFGSSDGEPRHQSDPAQHAEDYHDAAWALANMPGVDPEKVAIWGIGHSACYSMIAAADNNPRVKAAIFQRPIYSGGQAEFPDNQVARIWSDREAKIKAGSTEPTYIKGWPDSEKNAKGNEGQQAVVHGEAAYMLRTGGEEQAAAAGIDWDNKVTLLSLHYLLRAEAADYLPRIKVPSLYILGDDDPFGTPQAWQKEAFKKMGPNGELTVTPAAASGNMFDSFVVEVAQAAKFIKRVL